jgi:Vitamin K-dependent gamma-carboxylase
VSALTWVTGFVRARAANVEHWVLGPADPRAYGAVRIAFAVVAAAIWLDLWPLRESLFSSEGNFGEPLPLDSVRLNLFQWVRSPGGVTVVFVGVGAAIVCLGLGVWQRLSSALVYLWFVSYSAAASLALGGFDTVGRLTSLAVAVSPAVAAFSIKRARRAEPEAPVSSHGLRMLQWQLMLIYWVTFWLKAPDRYWRQGEVLSYFGVSMFARSPDPAFVDIGMWDPLLSWGTLLIELTVPVLLWKRNTRWFGMFLGLCLHGGIAIVGRLGLFSLAMVPLYLAFLERQDFDAIERALRHWGIVKKRSTEAPGEAT